MPRISVNLPPEKHHRYVNAKMERGEKSLQSLMIRAMDRDLAGADITPGSSPLPTIDSMANVPESVLTILRTHAHDPDCAECILAIGRIWSVGDKDIKDAIIRNCRVFARASEAIQEAARGSGSFNQGENPADYEKRVAELLEAEEKFEPADDDTPEPISDTETSRPGMAPVEEKPIRKTGGRRRNRG